MYIFCKSYEVEERNYKSSKESIKSILKVKVVAVKKDVVVKKKAEEGVLI